MNTTTKIDPELLVMEDVPDEAILASVMPYDGYMFPFEKNVDFLSWVKWWKVNHHYGVYITVGYVIFIFALKRFMKDRPPMNLQSHLLFWNIFLAAYSMIATWRASITIHYLLTNHGFYYAICSRLRYEFANAWMILAVVSKFLELGDTIFIVLRKKPLIFLHWYHHAAMVLFLTWYADENYTIGVPVGTINSTIHSLMYTYYALQTLKVPIRRLISMLITTLQILQLLAGLYILIYVYTLKSKNIHCCTTYRQLTGSALLGVSYLFLFLKFFYDAYIVVSMKRSQKLKEK